MRYCADTILRMILNCISRGSSHPLVLQAKAQSQSNLALGFLFFGVINEGECRKEIGFGGSSLLLWKPDCPYHQKPR